MSAALQAVTYLVRDYDEAIAWFRTCLGFTLVDDVPLGEGKRWVLVAAPGGGSRLLLREGGRRGAGGPGRPRGWRARRILSAHGRFCPRPCRDDGAAASGSAKAPRHEAYGTVAVFEDLYGNGWDLIQPE